MKHSEIQTNGRYIAKVSGKMVVVRVDGIGAMLYPVRRVYNVTNERTGRRLVFRSAQKFRRPAREVSG